MNNDDAARVKALANEIWSVDWNAAPIETWTPILAAALDEARRDTWEAAANEAENRAYHIGLNEPLRTNYLRTFSVWLRSQAQRLTPSQFQAMSRSGEEEGS